MKLYYLNYFKNFFAMIALMSMPISAFSDITAPAPSPVNETTSTTQTEATTVGNTPSGMTTQMTEDNQRITDLVNKMLADKGFNNIEVIVSDGTVNLKGSLTEDKLKAIVADISKIPGVTAVNIKEMNTNGTNSTTEKSTTETTTTTKEVKPSTEVLTNPTSSPTESTNSSSSNSSANDTNAPDTNSVTTTEQKTKISY